MRRLTAVLTSAAALVATFAIVGPAAADTPSRPNLARPAVHPVSDSAGNVAASTRASDVSPSGATCYDYQFPVTEHPGDTTVYQVWGRLCSTTTFDPNRTVEVLLHGGTYNHYYWDWPYQPDKYSYVKAATTAGFITLDLDRLGYGYSDHPALSETIEFTSDAWVAHQVIQYLRKGAINAPYRTIVEVGHSLGSATTTVESGTYNDVDGTVISGATHTTNLAGVLVTQHWYPACLDPKFSGSLTCASGYIADMPGQRCNTYYYAPAVDPQVCALDEKLKDTFTAGEFASFPTTFANPYPANQIKSPVLVALGDHDKFFCQVPLPTDPRCDATGSNAYQEYRYFPAAKSYQLYIEPQSGHMNNLQFGSQQWFAAANKWVTANVGVTR